MIMSTYLHRITPRLLKSGQWLVCQTSSAAREMQFSHRDYRGMYWLRCPDYAGLNGPGDQGMVKMSGHYIARTCQLLKGKEVAA